MQKTDLHAFHLSLQQARLWPLQESSQAYHAQCLISIEGSLNILLFFQVFEQVMDRHSILRTTFYRTQDMEVPVQVVVAHTLPLLPIIDLTRLEPSLREVQLEAHFTAMQGSFCVLKGNHLLRVILSRISPHMHYLQLGLPALCADASTLQIFLSEIQQAYVLALQGKKFGDEPLQYAEVSAWQRKLLVAEDAEEQKDYWRQKDVSQMNMLPFGERETIKEHRGSGTLFEPQSIEIKLQPEVLAQLQVLVQTKEISYETCLLACWQILLWRMTGASPAVVGVACDGRHYEELTTSLGLYTRFIPLSINLTANLSFERTLFLVADALREAVQKQEYFVWELPSAPENQEASFFPVCFEYESWPASLTARELTFSFVRRACCIEPFLVKLAVLQVGETLHLEVQFDPAYFSARQARDLAGSLQVLLSVGSKQPSKALSQLPLLSESEQRQLQHDVTNSQMSMASQKTLQQLFELQVERTPGLLAVRCGNEQITYEQLNARSNQLAHWLRRIGVGPNVPVGLCLERSIDIIVGLLGILKAGGTYVPLDPEQPAARLQALLLDALVEVVLTQEHVSSCLDQWRGGTALCIDSQPAPWLQESTSNLHPCNHPQDLAYTIYTSGSTGTSKGVMIRHEGVSNYIQSFCALLAFESGLHFATVSTLAADLGNTAIFCSLVTGGCLHILNYEIVTSGEAFANYVDQHPLDVLKVVPSHLAALLNSTRDGNKILPRRFLVLGGEVFPWQLYQRLQEMNCQCRIVNHYGPTETTIGVLVNILEEGQFGGDVQKTVPIGRSMANTEAYILDRYQHLAPLGMVGELYLAGAGLAVGYLHKPEQTAERFVPHPFSSEEGARLYRTGDLVYYTEDKLITFVGRADNQIKVRGYRVELGEIEAVLRRHINVWDSVVLQDHTESQPQLVAYVIPKQLPSPTSDELQSFLADFLPGYMLPSLFFCLEAFPLTQNGKIDRQQLPELKRREKAPIVANYTPRSPLEEVLLDIFREVLVLDQIDIQANFFRLGGHSLLAMQVISRIRTLLQVDLPIIRIFESPTIVEMARLVEQELHTEQKGAKPVPIPVSRQQDLPLSFAQQRLWFLDQLDPGNTSYNKPLPLRLQGQLNVKALIYSLNMIVQRHEILRTTFHVKENGQPVQFIEPVSWFDVCVVDFSERDFQRNKAQELIQQAACYVFDLARGPLLSMTLLRLQRDEHVLLLTMHHILSDAWSNTIMMREIAEFYNASVEGRLPVLPELPIQYADFAFWQRHWLQSKALEVQNSYWTKQLSNLAPLNLPTDYVRPPVQTLRGAHQGCVLSTTLSQQLKVLSQKEGVTLFMTLLAAFQILLARYTGQTDIALGTPIANRNLTEIEGSIGFFVNTLVLRTDLSNNPTFQEVLARVRKVTLDAYTHQDVPFEKLVEILQPERNMSFTPLFQVMFALQHEASAWQPLTGLIVSDIPQEVTIAKFDLTLAITETKQGLICAVEYNIDLFRASTIEHLLEHWQKMLVELCENVQQRIGNVSLLTAAEREQLLVSWNGTPDSTPHERCITQLIEAQIAYIPDAVAIVCKDKQLTYDVLNAHANRLARYLQKCGVGPEVRVGLCVESSLEIIVALLAILKAGGVYVPLDPTYPKERLAFMLKDAQVALLLTQKSLASRFLVQEQTYVVYLDTDWSALAIESAENLPNVVTEENLAYMIYTSGSTGQPKGVLIQHAGLLNVALSACVDYQLTSDDHVLQFASLSFDAAAEEIYSCLLTGATLVLRTEEMLDSLQKFMRSCAELNLTVLNLPTAYWHLLVAELSTYPVYLPAAVRLVIIGSERALPERLALWNRCTSPDLCLINAYGPTETTITATRYEVDVSRSINTEVPIGRAIQNMQVYILDQYLQLLPTGILGEVYIGGTGLARGYLHQAALTAENFVPHPFSAKPGARLYKTGDIGRRLEDGTLECIGRKDDQVKVRGYRIELGEIEAALNECAGVAESVVQAREDAAGEKRLVAYVVASPTANEQGQSTLSSSVLRRTLQERLPEYMVPLLFMQVQAFPLSPTGKVDRRALPAPQENLQAATEEELLPQSDMEHLIASVWQEALKVEVIGVTRPFFEVGGHSLLAIEVRSKLERRLGYEVALLDLFKYPTIQALADFLSQRQEREQSNQSVTDRTQKRLEARHRQRQTRRAPLERPVKKG